MTKGQTMTVFSEEYREQLRAQIEAQPDGVRDHNVYTSIVENAARDEFRDLFFEVRPPEPPKAKADVQDEGGAQSADRSRKTKKKTSGGK